VGPRLKILSDFATVSGIAFSGHLRGFSHVGASHTHHHAALTGRLHKSLELAELGLLVVAGILFGKTSVEAVVSETYAVMRGDSDDNGTRPDASIASLRRVLEALGASLSSNVVNDDLGAAFEQHVRQALQLRAVRLREVRARYQARLVTPTRTSDSIVLGVPTADPRVQAVFEASCQPDRPLAEPDYDMLVALAHVGGLVLEIGRGRTLGTSSALGAGPLIGSTDVMKALRAQIERVAATDFTVLIEGESGTGKELVARQLHELGRRRRGPFVAVNCAAVVETLLEAELFGIEERTATGVRGRRGKFEHADGGTMFLDEVSDLSLSAQAKFLRVLQDLAVERVGGHGTKRIDTRIVAATNRPLSDLVARGLFRADLYYRLSGVEIHVPPLRSRSDDVPELVRYFLGRHRSRELTLSTEAEQALRIYPWPGNVRELERLVERALAMMESDRIELDDLPARIRGEFAEVLGPAIARDESMRAWACHYARLVYERCRRLNISYHTLEAYLRVAGKSNSSPAKRLPRWVRTLSTPQANS
jgi:DNA-binding NtrC family response regulator